MQNNSSLQNSKINEIETCLDFNSRQREELDEKIKLFERKLDVQIQTALAQGYTEKDINKWLGIFALFIFRESISL